jgi:hypothetical protein
MNDPYYLTEEDVKTLKELVAWRLSREQTVNRPRYGAGPSFEFDGTQAPEVYLAFTPVGGIPAMGEPSGTGSPDVFTPGSAICQIYQYIPGLTPDDFIKVALSLTIYNISTTAVPQHTLVKVSREKFGIWVVDMGAGGGGGGGPGPIVNLVTNVCQYTGSGGGNIVEFTPTTLPAGTVLGTPICITNPTGCCDAGATPSIPCCPGLSLPKIMFATVTPVSGAGCPSLPGTYELVWNNVSGHWSCVVNGGNPPFVGAGSFDFVPCLTLGGPFHLSYFFGGSVQATNAQTALVCSPFQVNFSFTITDGSTNYCTVNVVVTA